METRMRAWIQNLEGRSQNVWTIPWKDSSDTETYTLEARVHHSIGMQDAP
jgi:hypothetical protein